MMAALPEGIMQARPTRARYPFGFCAYTCFQITHPPKPSKTTSRKFCLRLESHELVFTSSSFSC